MGYTLERTQVVPRPLEETFAFFSEPGNLGRITPPWLKFELRTPEQIEMGEGVELHYRIRPLGFPQRWTSRIVRWNPPDSFIDEQVSGPYSYWRHTHRFHQTPEGTEIHDRVDYDLPFAAVGRVVHTLIVSRQLRAIFNYRRVKVEELLGEAP